MKIIKYLKDKKYRFLINSSLGLHNQMPDDIYLCKMFNAKVGYPLNLLNPKTFNEKLQWLKLYDRKPEYTMMVDKIEVKKYISNLLGEEYIIPTLGVWNNFDEINFDTLPKQFVLKCTHDSGGIVVCHDKKTFDFRKARKKINKSLKRNYFYVGREWPYKNIKPRVFAEKYMEDESGELRDYKFMCFNGVHKCTFICTERFSEDGLKVTFFDKNWNIMPFERVYPKSKVMLEKPHNYEKMSKMAELVSNKIPFSRVDFYEVHNRIYFGEITLYPGNGFESFQPLEWDYKLGDYITLPK